MYNNYHVISFRSWHPCKFHCELRHLHKHRRSPSASPHSNPMLEQRNQRSSRITHPCQTTSTIHECLQKHDKVIKAAIWRRPPCFPDPKTNRVFRGWDGVMEQENLFLPLENDPPTPPPHLRNVEYLLPTSRLPQDVLTRPPMLSRQVGAVFGSASKTSFTQM